jgi:hypothetical protein
LPKVRFALPISLAIATLLVGSHGHTDPAHKEAQAAREAGTTITFPYRQRRLLHSRHGNGGLAYVTSGAERGASLPVVVFLHGMNPDEQMHMWFSLPNGDLRTVLEPLVSSGSVAPFILAAPTQTRFATGARVMWPRFDLADFLEATESALDGRAHVDRSRVIVVGHSAAGCNVDGGIVGEGVRSTRPLAILAVDTCVDDRVVPELATMATSTRVRLFWQRGWARPIEALARACESCEIEEVADLGPTQSAHSAILPEALRRALPELLPAR